MATQADVRRLAMALPGAIEAREGFAFSVVNKGKEKGFAWVWQERVEPKKPRVPQPRVLAVRVANEMEKAALLSADPDKFFTEPHYNGFPAVLVRLPEVRVAELRQLLAEAWRCQAPPGAVAAFDGATAPARRPRSPARPARRSGRDRTAATAPRPRRPARGAGRNARRARSAG